MTPIHRRLVAALDSYVPSTAVEMRHLQRIRRLASEQRSAFDRHEYEPGHITASAFVVHPTEPALALVLHRKLERWLQPGGHVEPDDLDMEAASRREVAEETGLSDLIPLGIVDVDVHTFPAGGEQPEHLHLDVRQGFVARTESLVPSDESDDVKWASFVECLAMEESIARPARVLSARDSAGTLRPH